MRESQHIPMLRLAIVILIGALLVAAFVTFQSPDPREADREALLARNAQRIEEMEKMLVQLRDEVRSRLIAQSALSPGPDVRALAMLEDRMERLEHRLATLQETAAPRDSDAEDARSGARLDENLTLAADPHAYDPGPSSIPARYAEQWGESEWGKASAASIDRAFVTDPFFGEHGGKLLTECKQDSCRVDWIMSASDARPESQTEILARAHYELLALATRNAEDVGRLDLQWRLEDGQPRASLYFVRNTPSSRAPAGEAHLD